MSDVKIRTGVISVHTPAYLWDDTYDAYDLSLLEHQVNCSQCMAEEYCDVTDFWDGGDQLIGFKRTDPQDDNAWFLFEGDYGKIALTVDPEAEYSAIVRESVVQVVRSEWVMVCEYCFPGTYPDQGNLDNPSSLQIDPEDVTREVRERIANGITGSFNVWRWTHAMTDAVNKYATLSYSLPPDMFDNDIHPYPTDRIFHMNDLSGAIRKHQVLAYMRQARQKVTSILRR